MKKNVIVSRAKYDIIPDEKNIHKGKAVMCITTGEVFKSAGMKFCYISEMGYKANDISASIIEMKQHSVSIDDYIAALRRNEELETEIEELKMQTSATKISEDFNTFMEAIESNNRNMEGMMRHLLALVK